MFDGIGCSAYLSTYEDSRERLKGLCAEGGYVFTSFHISEEFDTQYPERMRRMCAELREMGWRILGDVSKKTLAAFGYSSITEFAAQLGISILRIDYGFSEEEILRAAQDLPVCLNASTIDIKEAERLLEQSPELYAMHNFYPRPETGLDEALFASVNEKLRQTGVRVLAFIPGDGLLRGPLEEGLPTLECHRGKAPYAAYADMRRRWQVDGVFVGDGLLSRGQAELIAGFEKDRILRLPCELYGTGAALAGRSFTIRRDSPRWLKRFQESREYSCFGERIEPAVCGPRTRGSITVDNIGYKRYSGEVQLILEDLPRDDRVNVAGHIAPGYEPLLDLVENGCRIQIVEPPAQPAGRI